MQERRRDPEAARPWSRLGTAWSLFKDHRSAFFLAQLAIIGAWIVLEIGVVAAHRSGMPAPAYWSVWLLLHGAFFWVFCGLTAGMHAMALEAVDGRVPSLATALGGLARGGTYLLASLLYWTAVLAGLCLMVIPGMIAAARWSAFRFVVADTPQRATAALHEAAALSRSHRREVFEALAASLALNIVGAALIGVGLLVAFPVTLICRASLFRALCNRTHPGGDPAPGASVPTE